MTMWIYSGAWPQTAKPVMRWSVKKWEAKGSALACVAACSSGGVTWFDISTFLWVQVPVAREWKLKQRLSSGVPARRNCLGPGRRYLIWHHNCFFCWLLGPVCYVHDPVCYAQDMYFWIRLFAPWLQTHMQCKHTREAHSFVTTSSSHH